eukprot:TRINITY_DN8073_c0_g1_i1.p1 TRINITY_DN8073_c0_g1~~TRINITY_DN8073_c0_g1_i1.p1  ORF type:complete len:360 (-),score=55.87 TRINITY_DN8073_c0_g1_i1:28-1107(-)
MHKVPSSGLYALSLFLLVILTTGDTIRWDSETRFVGKNAGWGRMLPQFHGGALLTYTEYDRALPNGCTDNYPHPGPEVWIAYSTTNFANYTLHSWIPSPPGHIQEQSMIMPAPKSNRLLLVMRNRQPDCNWFGLPVVYSDDGAQTWKFLSQLDQTTVPTGKFNRGLWEPFLFTLPNGCIAGFYADETFADSGYNQIVSERVSCDGGINWGERIFAASYKDGVARPGMPGVTRMTDGRVLFTFEVCGYGPCYIHYKISNDGINWESGLGKQIPNEVSGPYVETLANGDVVVTSACTNEIEVSSDHGNTWHANGGNAFNVPHCPSGPYTWPAVYDMGKDVVGVLASGLANGISVKFGNYSR